MKLTIKAVEKMGSDNIEVFGGIYEGGLHLQQHPDEIVPCLNDIKTPVKNILEIGSAAGGMAWLFNRVFTPKNIIIVDDNKHPKHVLRKDILKDLQNATEFIGLSFNASIINRVKKLKLKFDIILIDGGHSYEEVAADVENYLPFLSTDGYLLLHDIKIFGYVEFLFDELKKQFRFNKQYISKTHKNPCGIGVLQR